MKRSTSTTRDGAEQSFAEDLVRLAIEACPSGMVMIDGSGRILMVNSEIERLFGYDRMELLGAEVDILVPEALPARQARHPLAIAHRLESRGLEQARELFGCRKGGSMFPVEAALTPIPDRNGTMILATVVDVSERKRIERLKDEFVSTVSHELRTPLTSIAGSLALMVGGAAGPLPDAMLRLLTIARNNSERLVRLINDILDIEKIESGQIAFDLKRVQVQSLVEQAIEATRAFADSFGVKVRLLPSIGRLDARADPDRLVQVLTNLLSNAAKFSPSGAEVIVAVARQGNMVRISVRDHGPGIPHGFRQRIFEKFAQADVADARQKGGTGLGLNIVRQIIIRLGGDVCFVDAPGGGTTFTVTIPRWNAADGRKALGSADQKEIA